MYKERMQFDLYPFFLVPSHNVLSLHTEYSEYIHKE